MPARVLVIDIGKTNAKLALVDTASLSEIAVRSRPNPVLPAPPYPHADVDGLWDFILEGTTALARDPGGIEAIVVTTHAATAALVDSEGGLAMPVLDYEFAGPDELADAYDAVRPAFAETGSPRLPIGLNLGAQIFWQFARFPEAAAKTAAILMYPQYWAYRLTGVAASEVTSLGCHSDLWAPHAGALSSLVVRQGWTRRMPPLHAASDQLGTLTPEVAARMGLPASTPVHCGIHDSNASLLPHLRGRRRPFAVVSTGTWVVSMAVGGESVALDPGRDTLINVSAFGDPVPSARFMGGREWSHLTRDRGTGATPDDAAAVLARGIHLLPAIEPGSGPFQGRTARWTVPEDTLGDGERAVASAYYLALMTSVCLGLIGAAGPAVVEGPFAANIDFCRMLEAATGRVVVPSPGGTGTSIGAALLTLPASTADMPPAESALPEAARAALRAHADAWLALTA